MSKTKYTPGPWKLAGLTVGHESGSKFDCVAWVDVGRLHSSTEEWKANAALIAAAPELAEALSDIIDQACVNGCPRFSTNDGGETVEHSDECLAARAALEKAGVTL